MADPTYIACPHCGEPYAMTAMQKRLYHGRTLTCQRCAKPFAITQDTPDPAPAPKVRVWQPQGAAAPAPQPQTAAPQQAPQPAAAASSPTQSSPRPSRRAEGLSAGRTAMLIAASVLVVGFLLYLAMAPSIRRSREAARRSTCASQLMQIGIALQYHATANNGNFPDALEPLVNDGSVPAELLVCPSSDDTVSPGASPAEQTANLAKGKHVSYVYVGKGKRYAGAKQLLAYEPLSHHYEEGVHVLYTDGTVQFLPRTIAQAVIPALAPPGTVVATQPTTLPAAPAR